MALHLCLYLYHSVDSQRLDMLKLFQCVSVHCSSIFKVGMRCEEVVNWLHRSQQGAKVQLWNMMMCFGRDHVIKDWQKRGETSFHSVCIHLLDCSCENISVPCLVWWDINSYHLHIFREAMKAHIPTRSTVKMNKTYQYIHFLLPSHIYLGMISVMNHGTFEQLHHALRLKSKS